MTDVLLPLFPNGPIVAGTSRELFVFKKHGHPFFFLPCENDSAIHGLSLYPAQRPVARFAGELLRWALRARLTLFIGKTSVTISTENPFVRFLISLSGENEIPQFAVLAGNPNALGRRFILLVFDAAENPVAVVKVGCGSEAIRLIQQEENFLASAKQKRGIPELRATFQNDSMRAFSLDFVEGDSPAGNETDGLAKILHGWIDPARFITAEDVRAWIRLKEKCASHPLFQTLRQKLSVAQFRPVISHGDFAPWNIKISKNGSWIALDWERGELVGFSTWDWFHYYIQNWILVDRLNARQLAGKIDELLNSDSLLRYAQETQTTPVLRELLLAYLLYSAEVIRPAEGLQTTRELLNVLSEKWQLV